MVTFVAIVLLIIGMEFFFTGDFGFGMLFSFFSALVCFTDEEKKNTK